MSRQALMLEAVKRGKYAPLFEYLQSLGGDVWDSSFSEIEDIIGFRLPNSARIHRPWWSNDTGAGHSQAMAWCVPGWKATKVNLPTESITFVRSPITLKNYLKRNDAITSRSSAPTMSEFRATLEAEFANAMSEDRPFVTIRASDLHRLVGGYPMPFNRMQMCCNAMREAQTEKDRTRSQPPSGSGASLEIEYRLPR
jgi:hypothetical protein